VPLVRKVEVRGACGLAAAATLLGAVVLLGWVIGNDAITRVVPTLVAMQPATAVDFLLLGVSLLLVTNPWRTGRAGDVAALVLVGGVVTVAGTGLVTELAGWRYPFEFLGEMDQNGGRMSGITAVGHLVLSAGITTLVLRRTLAAHVAGLTALAIGLIGLSGYAFGASDLYSVGYFQTLALHTALGIALLGASLVMATGEVGLTRLSRSSTIGGRLVRTLLPAVVVVPTVLGWGGVWLMRAGTSPGFVMALHATTVALMSGLLVWWAGTRLRQADISRDEAVQARAETDQALTVLNGRTEELRIANRDLRDFTSAAAHDLRGPLSAIRLGVQMLEDISDPDSRRMVLDRMQGATDRGMDLIDDLLDYQGVGTLELSRGVVDLQTVLDAVVADTEQASGRRVALAPGDGALLPVHADERLVQRLLVNLVSNAVKYTPDEGAPVDLAVSTTPADDGMVRVSVADRGLAIPDGEREQIFEIFQRGAEGAATASGTGVGLAICRRIVERHGGEIGVVDRSGWTKSFDLTLPAVPGVVRPLPQPSSARARSTATA